MEIYLSMYHKTQEFFSIKKFLYSQLIQQKYLADKEIPTWTKTTSQSTLVEMEDSKATEEEEIKWNTL